MALSMSKAKFMRLLKLAAQPLPIKWDCPLKACSSKIREQNLMGIQLKGVVIVPWQVPPSQSAAAGR
jgi:hypothetical protein